MIDMDEIGKHDLYFEYEGEDSNGNNVYLLHRAGDYAQQGRENPRWLGRAMMFYKSSELHVIWRGNVKPSKQQLSMEAALNGNDDE